MPPPILELLMSAPVTHSDMSELGRMVLSVQYTHVLSLEYLPLALHCSV